MKRTQALGDRVLSSTHDAHDRFVPRLVERCGHAWMGPGAGSFDDQVGLLPSTAIDQSVWVHDARRE